jgi:hypothetical protein
MRRTTALQLRVVADQVRFWPEDVAADVAASARAAVAGGSAVSAGSVDAGRPDASAVEEEAAHGIHPR